MQRLASTIPGSVATLAACSKTLSSISASSFSLAKTRTGTRMPARNSVPSSQTPGRTRRMAAGAGIPRYGALERRRGGAIAKARSRCRERTIADPKCFASWSSRRGRITRWTICGHA